MAPLVQAVFLIDVNYFVKYNSKCSSEHLISKLYLCCLRLLTEFGGQTDKENVRWAFKFYNSKKFKPDLSHKVFYDFSITYLKKFEQELYKGSEQIQENKIETRPRNKCTPNKLNASTLEKNSNEIIDRSDCHYSHSYILNKSLQEILLDYNWDRPDISSPVKNLKSIDDNHSERLTRFKNGPKQCKVELTGNEELNFVIVFTNVPKNLEECAIFIGKKTEVCSSSDIFNSLFDQTTLHGFKDEKKLRFHLINVSSENVDISLRVSLQTEINKLYGGIHEIENLIQENEGNEHKLFGKENSGLFLESSSKKTIKGTELSLSGHQWWHKKKISSRSRVPQPGPLLIWEDIDGVSFLKIPLELLAVQGSCSKQWENMHVKGVIRGNAMNLLGIGLPSSLLYVCHAPDTIFPALLSILSEQNLFMILQLESGGLVGLAPWVGGVGCLVLFSSTQLISPLTKCKSSTPQTLDGEVEKGLLQFVRSALNKVLKNAPKMQDKQQYSCFKRFQPQMIRTWYPASEASSEKLSMKPQKRSSTEQAMLERLQKKYRPQMPRPLSGSHLPPQALIDVTQPAAAAAVPDIPSTTNVKSNLRSSKLNVSRAQKLVKNSKIVTAQMRVKEQQAEEQEQQAASERKTIEAQNRAKKSIAIVAKTMKCINNPQDKDELAQALIRLRDNVDSVSENEVGQSVEDLYSTAQSVVNLALMHIKTNLGPNSVENDLRDVLSRDVLLSAKQVSCKCEEKYQFRQFKLQSLLLLEVLWVLGYSRPNSITPNKRKSPRKKKDIGEEFVEEILKLLRMMSLKYDPSAVGEFLQQIIVPNYQESLGEILVEIFEELNQPVPSSLAPYVTNDDPITPLKPLSIKSLASSGMSNGPNSSEAQGVVNGIRDGTKPSNRPLLKRETSRQIVVPHVKRPLQRANTMKEEKKIKTKGSSTKRELKSVCRNLFDKREKLKRSHTVASFASRGQRTPGKDRAKRKHSETKSPLKTPSRSSSSKNMTTPIAKRAKIYAPETPAHAIKTTVFNKQRLLKSTGSTLITESPDIKGGSKSRNVSRRTSLPLTRRTSFYSGAVSRNFERGKLQLRVSHIKSQLDRRNSLSNVSDNNDASFIFSEIIENNNRMDLRSKGNDEAKTSKGKDTFFRKVKPLSFGLDEAESVEPHRPSLSGRKIITPFKNNHLDSPLKKVRRSLSLLTPVKGDKFFLGVANNHTSVNLINNIKNDSITTSSTLNNSSSSLTPQKSSRCTPSKIFKNITPSKLSSNITPNKSAKGTSSNLFQSIVSTETSRFLTPVKLHGSKTPSSSSRFITPVKSIENITPRKSPRINSPIKSTEYMSSRKLSRIESPCKLTENATPSKLSGMKSLKKLSDNTTPNKSLRLESSYKLNEDLTPRKSSRIFRPCNKLENSTPNKLFNASTSNRRTPVKLLTKDRNIRITPSKFSPRSIFNKSPAKSTRSHLSESPNRKSPISPKTNAIYQALKRRRLTNSPTIEIDMNNAELIFDQDESNVSYDFVGFTIEDEHYYSSKVLKDSLTECFTPGKRVQFNFDSTPTKLNTSSVSRSSVTPRSILKTPHKSPNKTPMKVTSVEEKACVKRVLENTPTKSNANVSRKTDNFRKPSPFLFSPKMVLDSFTPPVQKENKKPSSIVNELFKSSTPTHFEALLHSPITSVEREKISSDKRFSLIKKATNSERKSHRKLQLPLRSPIKQKSPEKCESNWEFKKILNSPKKFLLDSCTEFEMVSPSKKSFSGAKTDFVFHLRQDESTINKVVEMSFQEKEKVIQELPVDQVDLSSEIKKDEILPNIIEKELFKNSLVIENNAADCNIILEMDKEELNQVSQEHLECEISLEEDLEPYENIKSVNVDVSNEDLDMVASLLNDLENDKNHLSEVSPNNATKSQNIASIYRKISHQDSDSGISMSNHHDQVEPYGNEVNRETCLKKDINNLISFLASPCKTTSKAVEVCEQNINSFAPHLDSNSVCNNMDEKFIKDAVCEKTENKNIGFDKFETESSFIHIINKTKAKNLSGNIVDCNSIASASVVSQFPKDISENIIEWACNDNAHLEADNKNKNHLPMSMSHQDITGTQDSPIILSSDTEEDVEIKEFPNIHLSYFPGEQDMDSDVIQEPMETDEYRLEVGDYDLSPEIPLDVEVYPYQKAKSKAELSSTKRKLNFCNRNSEDGYEGNLSISESLEMTSRKRKLSFNEDGPSNVAVERKDKKRKFLNNGDTDVQRNDLLLELKTVQQPYHSSLESTEDINSINVLTMLKILNGQREPTENIQTDLSYSDKVSIIDDTDKMEIASLSTTVSMINSDEASAENNFHSNSDRFSVANDANMISDISENNCQTEEDLVKSTDNLSEKDNKLFSENSDMHINTDMMETVSLSPTVSMIDSDEASAENNIHSNSDRFSVVNDAYTVSDISENNCQTEKDNHQTTDSLSEKDYKLVSENIAMHIDTDKMETVSLSSTVSMIDSDEIASAENDIQCSSSAINDANLVSDITENKSQTENDILVKNNAQPKFESYNQLITDNLLTDTNYQQTYDGPAENNRKFISKEITIPICDSTLFENETNLTAHSISGENDPQQQHIDFSSVEHDLQHISDNTFNDTHPVSNDLSVDFDVQPSSNCLLVHKNLQPISSIHDATFSGNLEIDDAQPIYDYLTVGNIQPVSDSNVIKNTVCPVYDDISDDDDESNHLSNVSLSIEKVTQSISTSHMVDNENQPTFNVLSGSSSQCKVNDIKDINKEDCNDSESSFIDVEAHSDDDKIGSSKKNLSCKSSLKRSNSFMNIDNSPSHTSPCTSRTVNEKDNLTPRRSHRKGKQTLFYESPINLDVKNYSLFSPVFKSKKKSKFNKTSRKLYDTPIKESEDKVSKAKIKLPLITEEELFSSPAEGIRPFSPPARNRLSDSFEVVSPLKNIKTFEKESEIPEEQKTPIIIRIRRKKKTPNPSPKKPIRASKLKALRNIENDIEKYFKLDDDFL